MVPVFCNESWITIPGFNYYRSEHVADRENKDLVASSEHSSCKCLLCELLDVRLVLRVAERELVVVREDLQFKPVHGASSEPRQGTQKGREPHRTRRRSFIS